MPGPATPALHAEWHGRPRSADTGPPVVLLHGFTQNARCWGPFGEAIGARHATLAVDAPGHGGSAAVRADLPTTAGLLAATIETKVGGPALVVGYSMGGRLALHLALRRPDLVEGLVLIGATAGIDDEADRAARRAADDALADHLLAIGVDAFLDEWLALPLFSGLTAAAARRSQRSGNDADGLASSLRLAGTGTQVPLWHRLGSLTMAVLVVAGAEDAKFRALGRRLADAVGSNATLAVVDGGGHAVHLEQPAETATVLEHWLTTSGLGRRC